MGGRTLRARLLISLCDRGRRLGHAVFASEFIHAAGAIDDLLLARIERMASGAYVDMQLAVGQGRARLKRVAATAGNGYFLIVGVDLGLHRRHSNRA